MDGADGTSLLDPDRLFPTEPAARAASPGRSMPRSATCRSSARMATPIRAGTPRTRPSPTRRSFSSTPRPLRLPHAALAGRGAGRSRGAAGRRRRRPRPTAGTIWRRFAENYHLFRGTPSRLWLDHAFEDGVRPRRPAVGRDRRRRLRPHRRRLARPEFRPRALFERFGIEAIATTESPLDDLRWHAAIRDSGWGGRVITAYRPDAVVDPEFPGFAANVARFGEITGCDTATWAGYLDAHRARRAFFKALRRHEHATTATRPRGPRTCRRPRRRRCSPRRWRDRRRRGGRRLPRPDADRDGADEPRRRAGAADPSGLDAQPLGRGARRLRPRQGLRHPDAHRLRAGAEAAARRGRRPAGSDGHRLHAGREHATRASWRRSPGSIRR